MTKNEFIERWGPKEPLSAFAFDIELDVLLRYAFFSGGKWGRELWDEQAKKRTAERNRVNGDWNG